MAKLITLKNIIILLVAWLLWKHIISDWIDISWNLPLLGEGSIENYGDPHLHYKCWQGHGMGDCEPEYTASEQCTQAAHGMCNTSDERLNNCWLPAFRKCTVSSALTNNDANCYKYADAFCGGKQEECANCFSKAHQSCMTSKGLGPSCN